MAERESIIIKLARARLKVAWVAKSERNTMQNYNFAPASEVYAHVRPLLADEGIVIIPHIAECAQDEIGRTQKDAPIFRTHLRFDMHVTDGVETLVVPWHSEAFDSSDKGINKAVTAAIKYFSIGLLMVPTGDDPDQDSIEVAHPPRSARQVPPAGKTGNPRLSAEEAANLKAKLSEAGIVKDLEFASDIVSRPIGALSDLSAAEAKRVSESVPKKGAPTLPRAKAADLHKALGVWGFSAEDQVKLAAAIAQRDIQSFTELTLDESKAVWAAGKNINDGLAKLKDYTKERVN